jgi:hypothetical protein
MFGYGQLSAISLQITTVDAFVICMSVCLFVNGYIIYYVIHCIQIHNDCGCVILNRKMLVFTVFVHLFACEREVGRT